MFIVFCTQRFKVKKIIKIKYCGNIEKIVFILLLLSEK